MASRAPKQTPRPIEGTAHLESMTFLTLEQVAELLHVTPEHVRRQWRKGVLPGAGVILGVVRVRTAVLLASERVSWGHPQTDPKSSAGGPHRGGEPGGPSPSAAANWPSNRPSIGCC